MLASNGQALSCVQHTVPAHIYSVYYAGILLTTVQMMTTHARTGAGAQNSLNTLDKYNY